MNLNTASSFMGFKCWAKTDYFKMSFLIITSFNCYNNLSLNFKLFGAEAMILIFIFLFATFMAPKIHYTKYFIILRSFEWGSGDFH
jgi:hypothetical protein